MIMKSIVYLFFIIAFLFGIASALFFNYFFAVQSLHKEQKQETMHMQYRIAIFEPAVHPAMNEIEQGFIETLHSSAKAHYSFKVYNANGNKTLLRAQAEELIQQHYDVIFTIGAACTQTIYELTVKKGIRTPLVFCAVDDPVTMGLVQSLDAPGTHATGVTEYANYQEQLDLLIALKPNTKTITLVYNPAQGSGLEKDKVLLEKLAVTKNIQLVPVEVYQAHEIQHKLTAFLPKTDVVLVLKDHTVVSGIDGLVNLCNRFNVTLYASDLNSGDKGAALSYGIREYDSGVEAAYKTQEILEEHKQPREIAVTPVKSCRIKINSKAMQQQGLTNLNVMTLRLLQCGVVV